jgi:hypothetical protein
MVLECWLSDCDYRGSLPHSGKSGQFLHDKKRITDEAWMEWRDGIKGNMELPAFKEVWLEVSRKFRDSFKELKSVTGILRD